MAKALVTGGTGFLGSHIARTLLDAGHSVRILRRATSSLSLLEGLPVEHAIGDVVDAESLERAMQDCDWVFHAAAVADYWRANRTRLYVVNVNGTINVLNAARQTGVRRVIFTSSAAAVGLRDDERPADETLAFNLPPQRFPYGHSKYLAELEVQNAVQRGQDAVILNPSVILGPGDANLISGSAIVEMARGYVVFYPAGGVTFIDVRDVAAAHVAAAERGRTGERYLLGAVDISIREAMEMLAAIAHVPVPLLPIPRILTPLIGTVADWLRKAGVTLPIDANQIRLSSRNLFYDCHKAWRELGEPRIGLRQSLEDTYRWYVAHGVIKR
jgi:dihydroflavonol-4-reductase